MPDLTGILSNRTNYRTVVAKQVINRQRGSFEVLEKVQTFVDFRTNVINMIIPFKFVINDDTKQFELMYFLNFSALDGK